MRIEVNKSASIPIWEQLAERLRFLIATGQVSAGQQLPSTRALARRLQISFHTVRRAYQRLVEEDLAESNAGRGFVVKEFVPGDKHDRLEEGAAVVARAVERLAALGLNESEMEYLLQEQLSLVSQERQDVKVVFVASFTEFAERGADRLGEYLGITVDPVALSLLDGHQDAEYVIAPFPIARAVQERLPRADVLGVRTELPPDAVELASRLYDHQTLLLVVRYSDAIPPLTRRLRNDAGYSGQVIAAVMEEGDPRLGSLVRQADGVIYTPDTARRMRPHLASAPSNAEVELVISVPELERIRAALPR